MQSFANRCVSLLLLIIFFMMSMGAYKGGSKWLAHELDHGRRGMPVLTVDHEHTFTMAHAGLELQTLGVVEHHLLHAAKHLQTPLPVSYSGGFQGLYGYLKLLIPSLIFFPPQVEGGRLFRPPRILFHS